MNDINEFLITTRKLRVRGRRACCVVRQSSIHILVWVLATFGVDLEIDLVGDDEAFLDPTSVNPNELVVAIQQLQQSGLDTVADEVKRIEVLLCAHLGHYDD